MHPEMYLTEVIMCSSLLKSKIERIEDPGNSCSYPFGGNELELRYTSLPVIE